MTRLRLLALALVACVALVAAAGCGGDDDDPAAAGPTTTRAPVASDATADPTTTSALSGPVDPCTLVTKTNAEAIAVTPLDDGVPIVMETSSCTYSGPVTGPTAQVEVYIGPGAKKYLEVDQSLQHELTPVTGVADEAYLEDFAIFFRKGDTWAMLRLVRLDDAPPYNERLTNAARDLATKL